MHFLNKKPVTNSACLKGFLSVFDKSEFCEKIDTGIVSDKTKITILACKVM